MDELELQERIEQLNREISMLPPGSISVKTVNGKKYFYHRVTVDGKRKETYLPAEKADALRSEIETRKALEKELKQLKRQLPVEKPVKLKALKHNFATNVRTGEQLVRFLHGKNNAVIW